MIVPRRAGRWVVAGSIALAPACAPEGAAPDAAIVRPDASACAAEAERLARAVTVYATPAPGSAPLAELDEGRFVYRCERRGDWLAIMFPGAGEAVDCSVRPAARACPIGWVRGDVEASVMG